jgi:hypothetical protein
MNITAGCHRSRRPATAQSGSAAFLCSARKMERLSHEGLSAPGGGEGAGLAVSGRYTGLLHVESAPGDGLVLRPAGATPALSGHGRNSLVAPERYTSETKRGGPMGVFVYSGRRGWRAYTLRGAETICLPSTVLGPAFVTWKWEPTRPGMTSWIAGSRTFSKVRTLCGARDGSTFGHFSARAERYRISIGMGSIS